MNRASIRVAPEYLLSLLGLPSGTTFVGVDHEPGGVITVIVENPALPQGTTTAEPVYESDGNGGADFVDWGLQA